MKRNFNKTMLFLLLSVVAFLFSCSDKDYYDPERQNDNPLQMTAPSDFAWQTTRSTNIKVEVNDEFSGQYNYRVEVFDLNPITEKEKAKVLANGIAKQGQAFTTKIALPISVESVFIQQTTPTGLVSVRYADATSGSVDCNFGTSNSNRSGSTRSMAATRSSITPPVITDDMFPTERDIPSTAVEVTGSWQGANGNYIINSKTTDLSQIGNTSKMYVTEDAVVTRYSSQSNHTIYILPGKKLKITTDFDFSADGGMISIGEGAELEVNGLLSSANTNKFYNKGTLTVTSIRANGSTLIYNHNNGIVNVSETLHLTTKSVIFYNNNIVNCKNYISAGSSSIQNNAIVTVYEKTDITSPDTWINNGTWTTKTMVTIASDAKYYNKCKLIVTEKLTLAQANFKNDAGAYIYAAELYMTNTRVELGTGAFFHVEGKAELSENILKEGEKEENQKGFYGTGEGVALLKMETAVRGSNSSNMVSYGGNLAIICDNHPEEEIGYNTIWTMDASVTWSEADNNTITIPENGECNPGFNTGPGEEPEDKDPDPEPYPYPFTYLFEDLWPFYGDYDMNDAVIQITQITKFKNETGALTALSFDYSLKAVGAGSSLGAAVMLDAISASSVSGVTYSSNAPNGFDVSSSGVESGQDLAVIPLFSNAHNFLGRNPGQFVNTVKGSISNVADVPIITVKIDFATPVTDNFDATTFNMFIIPSSSLGMITSSERKEVHMIGYNPSKRADTTLFGNNDDRSTNSKYYVSRDNLSWAIVVPHEFRWPVEYKDIKSAYSGFAGWVTSGGTENSDWWSTPDSEEFIY